MTPSAARVAVVVPMLVMGAAGAVSLAACTETPSYFPPCIEPGVDACPPLDAGTEADADGG